MSVPLPRPIVLLVENEADHRELFAESLAAFGYSTIVAQGRGESLIADAIARAATGRPQVAVVDMRLGDDKDDRDTQGLSLIAMLRPCLTIISTAFSTRQTVYDALKSRGASDIINKQAGPAVLKSTIESWLPRYCRCASSGVAHWHRLGSTPDGPVLTAPPEGARPLAALHDSLDQATQARLVAQLVAHLAAYTQPELTPPDGQGAAEVALFERYFPDDPPALSAGASLSLGSGSRLSLPDPAAWASEHRATSRFAGKLLAVCHRAIDLASVLVDEGGDGWIANQRHSGPHHRLYDLACLELDIIAALGPDPAREPAAFYELALAVLAPAGPNEPLGATRRLLAQGPAAHAHGLLVALRRAGCRWFPHGDARERVWALLLTALQRLGQEAEPEQARARLHSFAAMACLRLAHWGERWPLAGWDEPVWVEAADVPSRMVEELFRLIGASEGCVVVGLPHMSRLRLLQQFVLRQDVQRQYLGASARSTMLVLVNFDRMQTCTDHALFELMLTSLAERSGARGAGSESVPLIDGLRREVQASTSALLAQRSLEHAVATMLGDDETLSLCFLLHNFDEAYLQLGERPLSSLAALAEQHWGRLSFVLGLRDTPARLRSAGASASFERLFVQAPLFVPPDGHDGALASLTQLERRAERRLSAEGRQAMARASGGHTGLVAALFQAWVAGELEDGPIDMVTAAELPQVERACQALWEGLARDERQALSALIRDKTQPERALGELLANKGLLHKGAGADPLAPFSPLFALVVGDAPTHELIRIDEQGQFYRGSVLLPLKGDQYKLVHYLYSQQGRLCERDELIEHLYGANGGAIDTSTTNLHQLIRRTRLVLEPDKDRLLYLITEPGRGYRLVGTNRYQSLA